MHSFCFTILIIWMKIICVWWLMCKLRNNCTNHEKLNEIFSQTFQLTIWHKFDKHEIFEIAKLLWQWIDFYHFCNVKMRSFCFTTWIKQIKIIWNCWLMCKIWNNCTLLKRFEMILTYVLIENLNFQLMKFIEFKQFDFRIDQNSFRSIIRSKRF